MLCMNKIKLSISVICFLNVWEVYSDIIHDIEAFQSSTHQDKFASNALLDKTNCETSSQTKSEKLNWIIFDVKSIRKLSFVRIQLPETDKVTKFLVSIANSTATDEEFIDLPNLENYFRDKHLYLLELKGKVARYIRVSSNSALSVCHAEILINTISLKKSIVHVSKISATRNQLFENFSNLFHPSPIKCKRLGNDEKLIISFENIVQVEYVIMHWDGASKGNMNLRFSVSRDKHEEGVKTFIEMPTVHHKKINIYRLIELDIIGSYLSISKSDSSNKNWKLCRIHLFGKNIKSADANSNDDWKEMAQKEIFLSKRSLGTPAVIGISAVVFVVVVGLIVGIVFAVIFMRKKKVKENQDKEDEISFYRDLSKFNETIKKSMVNFTHIPTSESDNEDRTPIQIEITPEIVAKESTTEGEP